ncbi:MFS transporter [Streptomyces sp. NBC_01089]|uniref:MFS transporter n=1 Tax=Streptomyces sp. NBC_01089 TaxID=2903747 RepID=UPI00386B7704|nr:MHS family MFS transporter [Streptomyces sp. NBC_01089]
MPAPAQTPISKVALAGAIGTTIEWYDFFLYGTAAGIVFDKLFFPRFDSLVGTLLAFATFAIGFVARPLGGVVFGHFGDRVGRKTALVVTMFIMGAGTFLIGLLPTYDSIGVWAPVLLILLRIVQGVGVGGEWGGAVLMSVEHAPEGRKGYYGSWPQIGVPAGLMLGTGVYALLSSSLSSAQFLDWGWRIAFLLSGALVIIGLYIRLQVYETPAFKAVQEKQDQARIPIVELLRTSKLNLLLGMGTRMAEGIAFNTWGVFAIAYTTTELNVSRTHALIGVMVGAAVCIPMIPVWGAISDRYGRLRIFGLGTVLFGLSAFPAFALFNTGSSLVIAGTLVVTLGLFYGAMYGPQAALYAELFPANVRYSGVSCVYQVSGVFASGLTPLILTSLLASGGGRPWLMSVYIVAMSVLSLVSVILIAVLRRRIGAQTPQPVPVLQS